MQYIYMMRHGETSYNLEGRIQGRTDIPLNENGMKEARMAAEYFRNIPVRFDRVYSSPLHRAAVTASVAGNTDMENIIKDPRIVEMNFGASEGKPVEDLPQEVLNLFYKPEAYVVPEGGEKIEKVIERCGSFLESIADVFDRNPDIKNILAVSHGAALRGIISYIEKTPLSDFWVGNLENCCTLKISYKNGTFNIEDFLHPLAGTAYMVPPWKRLSGRAGKKADELDK